MKRQRQQCYALTIHTILAIAVSPMALGGPEKRLSLPPRHIDLSLTISQDVIPVFAPVIARIKLTNKGDPPLSLDVREDGAPYAIIFITTHNGGKDFRHDQWLRRSGPTKHNIVLAAGESTEGDVLIFFGPPTGFAFGESGEYSIQIAYQPDRQHAPVSSKKVILNVVEDGRENRAFVEELTELAYEFFGYDREMFRHNNGEQILAGYKLMHEILKVQRPHLVDPDGDEYNRKQASLVESLTKLLIRHPNSSYSGYIARYLGLQHIHAVMDEFSLGRHEVRENAEQPSLWDGTACRADPSYEKSLQYLTKADESNLWPRTTAIVNLALLHMVAQEWDKANGCFTELRTKYAESDGVRCADELQRQMAEYKAKLQHHKAAAP